MLNLPGDPGDKPLLKRPCVSARQAVHLGYSVNFLSDATGTLAVSNAARVGDGRGAAPGDPRHAADAVWPGDGDGGVGEGNPVRRRGTDAQDAAWAYGLSNDPYSLNFFPISFIISSNFTLFIL
jgi:hypothetical protein